MRATTSAATSPGRSRQVFAWLTVALLFYVSWEALRANPGGSNMGQLDKLLHFAAFVALAASSSLARPPARRQPMWLLCAWLLYGALIELLQAFVPGRDPSWLDLAADGAGIAVGLTLAHLLRRLPALNPQG